MMKFKYFGLILLITQCVFGETNSTETITNNLEKAQVKNPIEKSLFTNNIDASKSIVIIKGDRAVGTGFIAKQNSNTYLFSNIHVIMGQRGLSFRNIAGKNFYPTKMTVAADRDIIRFELKNKHETDLEVTSKIINGNPLCVYGNAGGASVVRKVEGKIIGVGPVDIETDAKFIKGHSGSPMCDVENKVIGIATYVMKPNVDWINTNTQFSITRRFGVRIDNVKKWLKVNPKKFYNQSRLIAVTENKINNACSVVLEWSKDPYWQKLYSSNGDSKLCSWINDHNKWVNSNNRSLDQLKKYKPKVSAKYYYDSYGNIVEDIKVKDSSKLKRISLCNELRKEFETDYANAQYYICNLITKEKKKSKNIKWHLPYLKKRWKEVIDLYDILSNYLMIMEEELINYDPVVLKKKKKK